MIEQGWAALRTGDATAARDAFERAVQEVEPGGALEGLGLALYLQRDYSGAIVQHERAYTAYRKEGETFAAGRAARILAWITGNVLGDWAVQNGWLARALRVLTDAGEDTAEHGWVLIIRSYTEPDAAVREALFREAIAIGRRFTDLNLEIEALASLGGLYLMIDRVDDELGLLDESMAALCAGELTEIAHYGGILTAAGRWQEAEVQLIDAARHFDRGMPQRRAAAIIRLADLRVRQGRLEEARQLLKGLEQRPDAVRTQAAFHLARGDVALARDLAATARTAGSAGCHAWQPGCDGRLRASQRWRDFAC